VNVFPSQVEAVLMTMSEASPHYQLVIRREHNLDTLEVKVEIDEKNWSDSIRVLEGIRKRIEANIKSMLGITAIIKLVEPNTIQRSEGKAQRIIDLR
jgi:phenylacetate-CoA ligase